MRAATGLLLLLAAAAVLGAEKKKRAAPRTPRELFLARCSTCHDPGRVYHRRAGRDQWREIVFRMQRMPQSGIAPREAETIVDYLVSLGGKGAPEAPGPGPAGGSGGRAAYGKEWLSVLEVATVRGGRVLLGGATYTVKRNGASAVLTRGRKSYTVALDDQGRPARTARIDGWKIGEYAYEIHLVFYEIRGDRVRIGRALRRTP